MGGFLEQTLLRLSHESLPRHVLPAHGNLKGGAYGNQEKGQKESQKEKEISTEM